MFHCAVIRFALPSFALCMHATVYMQHGTTFSQTKKSQSGNISPIWGEAPTAPIETKFCVVGHLADVITYAKFQVEIFRGYDFTGVRIFHFPIDFCMGLTTVQRDCAACDRGCPISQIRSSVNTAVDWAILLKFGFEIDLDIAKQISVVTKNEAGVNFQLHGHIFF